MSGFNVASHSPCQTNRFETLIRHIELLSESIMRDVRIDLSLDQLEGREHVMFTQTKSIVKIVEKLRELFQITQTVTNHLIRYKNIIERLLHDFRNDIRMSRSCSLIRDQRFHNQVIASFHHRSLVTDVQPRDHVQDVLAAETNVMGNLKRTMETQLHKIHSVNHEMSKIRMHLCRLIQHHESLLDNLSRARRVLYSSACDPKLEPKLIDYLNESYPDQWSPSFLLKNIETSCSQANHVRMNLIDLIDRLPKFVRDVQNTLYHTLTGHSTTLVRQWIDAKALKAVQDKRHLLNQSKLQLDQLRSRLERNMNTDLQLIRFRRRESSERLYPQVNVYPLSTLNFPTVVSRT